MNNNKADFIQKFNEAFLKPDVPFIMDSVTEDILWTMPGMDQCDILGKQQLQEFFDNMNDGDKLHAIDVIKIVTHGKDAAAHGTMEMRNREGEISTYGYCDFYEFSGFKNPKIKRLTSYAVTLKDQ